MTCVSVRERAAVGAGACHAGDGLLWDGLAGLVVLREGAENVGALEELLEHLRRDLDEVAFGGDAALAGPALLAAEDLVHEMAELVEVGDDVGVLQQGGVFVGGLREVADERCFGELLAAHAANKRALGEPLALALARVHVEVDSADGNLQILLRLRRRRRL